MYILSTAVLLLLGRAPLITFAVPPLYPGAMRIASAALVLLTAPTVALRPRVVRVCPSTGRDDSQLNLLLAGHTTFSDDTIELATVSAAQSATRVLRRRHPDEPDDMIEVVLCPEVHALHSPLRFTAQDHHQVWRGENLTTATTSTEWEAMHTPTLSGAVYLPQAYWARVPNKTAFESPIPAGVTSFRHLWRSGDGVRLKRATLEGTNGTCGGFDTCTFGVSPNPHEILAGS